MLFRSLAVTSARVVPGKRGGVLVDFSKGLSRDSAQIVLRDAQGKFLPPGSQGVHADSEAPFIVGHDGRAFVKNLRDSNTLTVNTGNGTCSASFNYAPRRGDASVIDNVVCR